MNSAMYAYLSGVRLRHLKSKYLYILFVSAMSFIFSGYASAYSIGIPWGDEDLERKGYRPIANPKWVKKYNGWYERKRYVRTYFFSSLNKKFITKPIGKNAFSFPTRAETKVSIYPDNPLADESNLIGSMSTDLLFHSDLPDILALFLDGIMDVNPQSISFTVQSGDSEGTYLKCNKKKFYVDTDNSELPNMFCHSFFNFDFGSTEGQHIHISIMDIQNSKPLTIIQTLKRNKQYSIDMLWRIPPDASPTKQETDLPTYRSTSADSPGINLNGLLPTSRQNEYGVQHISGNDIPSSELETLPTNTKLQVRVRDGKKILMTFNFANLTPRTLSIINGQDKLLNYRFQKHKIVLMTEICREYLSDSKSGSATVSLSAVLFLTALALSIVSP